MTTIMARIIRDIPTFSGTVHKGTSLPILNGGGTSERPANRWNLGSPIHGHVVLSNVRKGQDFELVETPAVTSSVSEDWSDL